MTIERPMFPPVGNVVQFSAFAAATKLPKKEAGTGAIARNRDKLRAKREERVAEIATNPNLTTTCINQRLRLSRREVWWTASHLTDYWHARLKWNSVLSWAQSRDIADANSFPKCDDNRLVLVDLWRTALVSQMLTPAPDAAAVTWKRAQLRAENFRYTDVKPEALQRVIDADVEWLEAHPTRRSNSEAMTRRREFNDAMRQRIRDIAASRDLSDEEIKPALKLKHHEIGKFIEKHGVNLEWLLEGRGRIFKSWAPQ
jgi:hypothetical protein